jgi:hypothetical protein
VRRESAREAKLKLAEGKIKGRNFKARLIRDR